MKISQIKTGESYETKSYGRVTVQGLDHGYGMRGATVKVRVALHNGAIRKLTPAQLIAPEGSQPESTTERDECQVCERSQALKGGTLVNHGYTRPGCGWLIGGCMGVGHKPFPETDVLERYLGHVQAYLMRAREQAASPSHIKVQVGYRAATWQNRKSETLYESIPATVEAFRGLVEKHAEGRKDIGGCRSLAHEVETLGEDRGRSYYERSTEQGFETQLGYTKREWLREVAAAEGEVVRVTKRIAEGQRRRQEA